MAHGHQHGHGHGVEADFAGMAEFLDLDAEVFGSYLDEIVTPVGKALTGTPDRRIADLGCGSGAGTFALLALGRVGEDGVHQTPLRLTSTTSGGETRHRGSEPP